MASKTFQVVQEGTTRKEWRTDMRQAEAGALIKVYTPATGPTGIIQPETYNGKSLTVSEAAKALNLSADVLYRGIAKGEIPNCGVGSVKRIPKAWVDKRLMAQHETNATAVDIDAITAVVERNMILRQIQWLNSRLAEIEGRNS